MSADNKNKKFIETNVSRSYLYSQKRLLGKKQ